MAAEPVALVEAAAPVVVEVTAAVAAPVVAEVTAATVATVAEATAAAAVYPETPAAAVHPEAPPGTAEGAVAVMGVAAMVVVAAISNRPGCGMHSARLRLTYRRPAVPGRCPRP